jgi:hypothetical protein
MKLGMRLCIVLLLSYVIIVSSFAQAIPADSVYLGQASPGNMPKIFNLSVNPGFFPAERVSFSPDGKNIYYSELGGYYPITSARIKHYGYSGGKWNGPDTLFENYFSPALSPDGTKMYFQHAGEENLEIWYSVNSDTGWSAPSRFLSGLPFNYLLQETNNGHYYCASYSASGGLGLRDWSRLVISGTDSIVQSLGRPLCTTGDDIDFSVSRDESYFISSANGNLCISYHKPDGSWTNPKKLISTPGWAPCLTSDNTFLFFTTGSGILSQGDTWIYWVRVDNLIDSLKHTNYAPYAKWPITPQNALKGELFTFTLPDSTFYDDDHDSLSFSAVVNSGGLLPAWLSFDPATRTFSGTPTATRNVPLSIKISAADTAHAAGSCIFSLSITNPTGLEDRSQHPKESQILQNYPNPFNPTTTIHYSLAKSSFVRITIYDLLGKNIRTLQKSFQQAGEYSLVWDAKDERHVPVSSGMYFYRLEADNLSIQRKMVLLK